MVAAINLPIAPLPEASVVVIGFRRADLLRSCLESLARHRSGHEFEVVVVLNGAVAEVRAVLDEEVSGAIVLRSPVNLGFAGGCNLGVSTSRGRYVALLNDDAVVEDGWLDALVTAADALPALGALASLVLFEDGVVQDAGGSIGKDGHPQITGRGLSIDDPLVLEPRRIDFGSGCALFLRRAAWDEVGGMDPRYYPAYFEDADLCLRLRQAGWETWFEPRAVVRHIESASTDPWLKGAAYAANRQRFLSRWAPRDDADGDDGDDGDDGADIRPSTEDDALERANDFQEALRQVYLAALYRREADVESALSEAAQQRAAASAAEADAQRARDRTEEVNARFWEQQSALEQADNVLDALRNLRSVQAALALERFLERHRAIGRLARAGSSALRRLRRR